MQELKAKWVFDQGGFSKALIACTPMGTGYHLHLVRFGRQGETDIIERQRGGWRLFKTIDAAVPAFFKIVVAQSCFKQPLFAPARVSRAAPDLASRHR